MRWQLRQVTPPDIEPVSVETMKEHSRIDLDLEDGLINGYITAARRRIENELKRALITQTWDMWFDTWPSFPLDLPLGNLQSVTHIKYYDEASVEAVWNSSNYQVSAGDPGRIALKTSGTIPGTALRPLDGVVIRFVCGYGDDAADVPADVTAALQLHSALLYENRESITVGVVMVPLGRTVENLLWPNRFFWNGRGIWR